MKILHVITGLATGGAERALLRLCEYGGSASLQNTVLSLSNIDTIGSHLQALEVPVFSLDIQKAWTMPGALTRLRQIVRKVAPDVVQGWMYHGNLAAALAMRWTSGNTVLAWNIRHSLYDLAYEKNLTRWVIRCNSLLSRRPEAIVYNSFLARSQHEEFGFSDSHGIVLPNGFDLDRYSPNLSARQAVLAELGIPEGVKVIGHVARLHPMKDHSSFLQALEPVLAKHTDVHVILAGRGIVPEQSALASGLGKLPADQIHCVGERRDTERLMAAMDLLVSSSAYGEAFPNVLGEAMACGVPCVATDVGDSARIIGDKGIVVAPGDPMTLAASMDQMLTIPDVQRQNLGLSARVRIAENYSIKTVVGHYRALYERLAEGGF